MLEAFHFASLMKSWPSSRSSWTSAPTPLLLSCELISEEIGRSVSRSTFGRTMVRLRLLPEEKRAHRVRKKSPKCAGKRDAYRKALREVPP